MTTPRGHPTHPHKDEESSEPDTPQPLSVWNSIQRELTLTQFLGIVIPILCGLVIWGNRLEGEVSILKEQMQESNRSRDTMQASLREHGSTLRDLQLGQVRVEARQSDQGELIKESNATQSEMLKEIKNEIDNMRARIH